MPAGKAVAKATQSEVIAAPTIGDYLALSDNSGELMEALKENIGDDTFSEFDINRVKVPSGDGTHWKLPTFDGEELVTEIEGVIVAWYNRRAYWPGRFGGGNEPPQCASQDAIRGIGDPGGSCAECPYGQFGSSTNEESPNAQACKAFRLMFVLTPAAMIPTVVVLPATSLKNARQYMFRLSTAGIPHTGVVTHFTLERDRSSTGIEFNKVTMRAGERLSPDDRTKVLTYAEALMPAFSRVTITQDDAFISESDRGEPEQAAQF